METSKNKSELITNETLAENYFFWDDMLRYFVREIAPFYYCVYDLLDKTVGVAYHRDLRYPFTPFFPAIKITKVSELKNIFEMYKKIINYYLEKGDE